MPLTPEQQAKFDLVCDRLMEGQSLRKACSDDLTPSTSTVMAWLADRNNPEAVKQYQFAREVQAELFADDMRDIANDASSDYVIDEKTGKPVLVSEHVQRSRLRVETLKWTAGVQAPRKYGPSHKIDVTHSVEDLDIDALRHEAKQVAAALGFVLPPHVLGLEAEEAEADGPSEPAGG